MLKRAVYDVASDLPWTDDSDRVSYIHLSQQQIQEISKPALLKHYIHFADLLKNLADN